jgi:hypothetical protein
MVNAQFTESDIKDKAYLEEQIELEAQRLFSSEKARRGRTLEEIRKVVRQGKVAEIWLIENHDFQPAPDIYHDLIDKEGNRVEVKAYNVYSSNAPYVQNDLYRIRTSGWNHSKWYLLFHHNEGVYKFLEKILIR